MKKVFIAFLAKTLNLPPDSVAEKLYKKSDDGKITEELSETALDDLLTLDADRVKGLKGDPEAGKTAFDNGYKKAQKDIATKFEKDVKEVFGLTDTDKTGLDLLKEGVSKVTKTTLDDDKVKVHKLYLELEAKARKEKETLQAEYEAKLLDVQKQAERKDVLKDVTSRGAQVFEGLRPVLPTDPNKAVVMKTEFLQKLEGYEWEKSGDEYIQMKDGKRVEDAHGNPITLKSFVATEAAKRFDFMKQDQKGNGGNKNDDKDGGFKLEKIPATKEELTQAIFNATSGEERLALKAAFDKAQTAGAT